MTQFLKKNKKRRNATHSSGLNTVETPERAADKACEPSAYLVNTPGLHFILIARMTTEE